ncbi:hemin uptake protein HemP [Xylophilus ampelinus]|uniref:Hemin uptake protein hemP n=1 Tax=Xylophilus ampelinus TaxID=54067 RepID=A0A318SLC9_9BURK|nr:hemin uptake protein HemP [Xylophilus ampelinus]MCS4510335.1 hemin uptake protein HemP [Xylophilus ampelinus]PYE78041.1 hemin uptake protein hemP [Xylophilus ampelinus]
MYATLSAPPVTARSHPALNSLPADDTTAQGFDHRTTVESEDLLRGGKSVEISHNGSVYRLQATRLGKLILTK